MIWIARSVVILLISVTGYLGFEAYTIYSLDGAIPRPIELVDAVRQRANDLSGRFNQVVNSPAGTPIDYRFGSGPAVSSDEFVFSLRIDTSEELKLTSNPPPLIFPTGCIGEVNGSGRSGNTIRSYNYRVTCGTPLYDQLQDFGDRKRREQNNPPFDVTKMTVAPLSLGLLLELAPNSRTMVGEPYTFNVVDESGVSRGQATVVWTQPEMNVGSSKTLSGSGLLGMSPLFGLNRNEIDAYLGHDLKPFFSVKMQSRTFSWIDQDVWDWIEKNVPVYVVPNQSEKTIVE